VSSQEQRDADLMLALRELRALCDRDGVEEAILVGYETYLPGWDPPVAARQRPRLRALMNLGLAMRIPKLPARYRPWGVIPIAPEVKRTYISRACRAAPGLSRFGIPASLTR
jgi:hypothetical protein